MKNTNTKVPASVRRAGFNAEVNRVQQQTGLGYSEAFNLVAAKPEFASEFANDADLSADLAGATKRRDDIQKRVREMMTSLGLSYDSAFAKVLKDDPKLQGHVSVMMAPQGFIRFNFSDAQSLTTSKTDYSQQAGFKQNDAPMPRANLGQAGVVSTQWDSVVNPPKLGGRLKMGASAS